MTDSYGDEMDGPDGPDADDLSDERTDDSLNELRELAVDPDPSLEGRVLRDINRRTLAADSLDFSLNVMLHTFWDHLRSLVEAWPGARPVSSAPEEKED